MDKRPRILAIDDETDILTTYEIIFKNVYDIITASSGKTGINIIKSQSIDLLLLDIKMPKMSGTEVLKEIKKLDPDLPIIMVTALKDVSLAVECMKLSAYDYILKPFDNNELKILIEKALGKGALIKENQHLKALLQNDFQFENIVGKSKEAIKLFEMISKVSKSDSTILITGESGTGKELVAKAIHKRGIRSSKPFVAVNCASIPESLLETELFGHEKGSFTGANDRHIGKFEIADEGTLFLDEIGCMPPPMQSKLLRVLQENHIERVGGSKSIPIDVRVVAATNINIQDAILKGKFREDLYYRLNVIPILIPPLRERKDDIPLLIQHFIKRIAKTEIKITGEVIEVMSDYMWPGNIRELENLIERLVILSVNSSITIGDLPIEVISNNHKLSNVGYLKEACKEFEKRFIEKVLKETNNNHSRAAKIMGLHRTTLLSKMEVLGIDFGE